VDHNDVDGSRRSEAGDGGFGRRKQRDPTTSDTADGAVGVRKRLLWLIQTLDTG
jgi:hypothetical protein